MKALGAGFELYLLFCSLLVIHWCWKMFLLFFRALSLLILVSLGFRYWELEWDEKLKQRNIVNSCWNFKGKDKQSFKTLFICECEYVCVEVKGQVLGVGSFLPRGCEESHLGCQAWWQALSMDEPSCWCRTNILIPIGSGERDKNTNYSLGIIENVEAGLFPSTKNISCVGCQGPNSEDSVRCLSEAKVPSSQQTSSDYLSLSFLGIPFWYLGQFSYLLMRFSASLAKCFIWAYSFFREAILRFLGIQLWLQCSLNFSMLVFPHFHRVFKVLGMNMMADSNDHSSYENTWHICLWMWHRAGNTG